MLVVSDTSPLSYLILIDHVDVLPRLFGRVVIPPAVFAELSSARAPDAVQAWAAAPPTWLEVRAPQKRVAPTRRDYGEREAIALALELHADLVLIDDRKAREAARQAKLIVRGLIGVLELAILEGMAEPVEIVQRLKQTTFRIEPSLLQALLGSRP